MTNLIMTVLAFIGTNTTNPVWKNTNCLSAIYDKDYVVIKYLESGKTNEMFFWNGGFRVFISVNQ